MQPTQIDSSTLSTTSSSPMDESPEAPLVGLCETPMHLMSEEQRRAKVMEIRRLRDNTMAFRAAVASGEPRERVISKPTGLEDLL